MKRNFQTAAALLVLALVIPILSQCSSAETSATSGPEAKATANAPDSAASLKVGDRAPEFTLPDQNGKSYSLSQFQGKENVVLAFYVLAFTGG